MKRRLTALLLGLWFAATMLATAGFVQATLGEPEDSVNSDRTVLEATGSSTVVHNGYAVRELQSAGVTLREYVDADGIIFAIAWNGLIHPDLTPLLGAYAEGYETALRQTPREHGRRRLRVRTDQIIVEKWGHMRDLRGRAYIPALIPTGVKVDEIK